ncbi:uncharacterized protein Z518_07113 [Rhinocladiella mackenziei CBS 650.93]|uniref:Uncharacterized protein n=1 Tax=Rhinocladiella mackenziei CBS 650.93 TaxID=1442369 RepID=A0A0D2J3M6_9EURO|nr:uncharacterized protein Z518_07113 [Rhinocladiella mackenziei CBS 650.93]KIX03560.1 hypothetical protein Z518_07113 [Rhinocladiella mackenziei CBS 650.93]
MSQSPKYTPPFGFPISTPDGVVIRTPSLTGNSPSQVASPHDEPSPLSAAVAETMALDRVRLFLHGRFDDLAKTMNDAEKATMSTWLYQFWVFAFMTSKHWGKGPRDWTRDNLNFDAYESSCHRPSPASPALLARSPVETGAHEDVPSEIRMPSQLCRWSIHVVEEPYESVYDEVGNSGSEWPPTWEQPPLEERLRNALENNDFSNIATNRLPLAMSQIVKAVERSPHELLLESFSFSIMARNEPLLEQMLRKVADAGIDIKTVYPLHIATSYLDGGSACCNILDHLCSSLPRLNTFYTNDHGHTVLDNLMLTILKGHSNSSPDILDETLTRDSSFAGIEVDLCGRWDADSPCFRALLQSGKTKVPLSWKHKFCHTSVLAVCHCIDSLGFCGLLGRSSGLFVRRCFSCGLSLQLSPLHVLVLTTFQLARSGCEGEDLFGMIAVLLCMLANRMDPQARATVSIDLLLGIDDGTRCTHEDLRPVDLAERLPSKIINGWSAELRRGWQIFCHILRPYEPIVARSRRREPSFDNSVIDFSQDSLGDLTEDSFSHDSNSGCEDDNFRSACGEECDYFPEYYKRSDIGHVWAAVQTELLTYRRINEADPWISSYFDLDAVLAGLKTGEEISMPLFDNRMIKPYCRCGRPGGSWKHVLRERIAEYYFGNLDVWDRASFIGLPCRFW